MQSSRSLRARPRPWPSSPASARPALQEEGGQERGGEGGSGGRAGEGRERAPEAAAGTVALVAVRCHRQSPPEPQSGGMAVSVPVGQPGQWSGHSWRPGRCRSSRLTQGGWEGTAPGTAPGKGTLAPRVSPVMGEEPHSWHPRRPQAGASGEDAQPPREPRQALGPPCSRPAAQAARATHTRQLSRGPAARPPHCWTQWPLIWHPTPTPCSASCCPSPRGLAPGPLLSSS